MYLAKYKLPLTKSDALFHYYEPVDGALVWVFPIGDKPQLGSHKCSIEFVEPVFYMYLMVLMESVNAKFPDDIQGTIDDFEALDARDIVVLKQQGVLKIDEIQE